ncbi:MAG: hypothetical protein E6J49_15415 [Chloroflexi bacterium]|nr:MAG: hypothetical protein E6J49_15415 [Chloroflexota bacterium]
MRLRGDTTQVIDLGDRMLLPGFIDAHTHFGNAAAWAMRLGLYDAGEPAEVLEAVARAARRLPEGLGLWITGGDIGAAAAWEADAAGRPRPAPLAIDRKALDSVATENPVLLRRIDGAYVANSLAIARARVPRDTPDVRGGRKERDASGELNGIFHGRAGERLAEAMPPPNLAQQIAGASVALADLARAGITSVHDVARLEEVSQRTFFHTFIERSATDLALFRALQAEGVRITPTVPATAATSHSASWTRRRSPRISRARTRRASIRSCTASAIARTGCSSTGTRPRSTRTLPVTAASASSTRGIRARARSSASGSSASSSTSRPSTS